MTEYSNIKTVQEKWNKVSKSFSSIALAFEKVKKSSFENESKPLSLNTSHNIKDIQIINEGAGVSIDDSEKIITDKKESIKDDISVVYDDEIKKSEDEIEENTIGSDWDFLFKNEELLSTPLEEDQVSLIDDVDLNQEDDDINAELLPDAIEELEELLPQIQDLLQKLGTKEDDFQELYRLTHTLKGVVGSVGAKKARSIIHVMENAMEEWDNIEHDVQESKNQLLDLFSRASSLIQPLITGEWVNDGSTNQDDLGGVAVKQPRTVRVQAQSIDTMVSDVNEGRLLAMALDETINSLKVKLKYLEESAQHISRMSRDLELQAEIQIQSSKTQNQEVHNEFDPLEFDRFTRLQELSKTIGEGVTDVFEIKRELSKIVMEQEAVMAQQKSTIQSTQENLRKTRLTPADAINDRLHNVVRTSSKEVGKDVFFKMTGSRVELDRVLLEKIVPPLEHILRNSVVHGIEDEKTRIKNKKPSSGNIDINISQRSDRVLIDVVDDGSGLNVEKIKEKAVQRGLWDESLPMSDKDAAEIICSQGFSTAESTTTLAGRGVGMDVVRSQILSLGGRFEIISKFGKGMEINIQLPTSVATSSVLLVNSGSENWAFSIEIVEHVILLPKNEINKCRKNNKFSSSLFPDWKDCPFYRLDDLTGVKNRTSNDDENSPILLLRERGQLIAIEVQELVQVFEVPLRPSGSIWNDVNGVAGTVILPNGNAVFLLDPFRFTSFSSDNLKHPFIEPHVQSTLVMVVDDSLTVRKASARFLQLNGFEHIEAKDGHEALKLLEKTKPSIILLDIEMPRMDGFDCLKNIRENPSTSHIPVIMITSRTADKHKKHAFDLGANEYLGKPFKDDELLRLINKYLSQQNSH